ncbi:DNA methyltransferase [bacterium]|nr:DNA methyltransferase [bacterium]
MATKNIIIELLTKHTPENIEKALVVFYIRINKISIKKNLDIKNIIENTNQDVEEIIKYLSKKTPIIDIYNLINYFETIIPQNDRKINGAFFTPRNITKFISQEIINNENFKKDSKICDPSCGCGAFLIECASEIKQKTNKKIVDIIEDNLYGVDLAPYSIKRAKILLSLLALSNDEDKKEISFNLQIANSLHGTFLDIFKKTANGFDFVIGNPPYVKFQDLDKETRNDLAKNWKTIKKGNYNLYFAFFELGLKILKENGSLIYITPNNYFTSIAGINLREFLYNNYYISKIIDFNHLKLFEAQTYTCITFLNKIKKSFFYYEKIDNYKDLQNLNNLKFSKIDYKNLSNKKWRLLRDVDQKNIEKIEKFTKLRDIVDIKVGVATCKDSIYFIDGIKKNNKYYFKTYNNKEYKIEKSITKPILKISDFKDQTELNKNSRRIIFPYKKTGDAVKIIPGDELKTKYPECYKYFINTREELATRDKGSVKYAEWYAYARTQGLNFYGEKLTTPTFSNKPRFLKEDNPDTLFCNGYAIYQKNKLNLFDSKLSLLALSKILNSDIMDYYIKNTSVSIEGGFPCYQKNFIELFGIPKMTKEEINFLENEEDVTKIKQFLLKKYNILF